MTYHLYNGAKDVANSNSNMQFYASLLSRNILEETFHEIAKLLKYYNLSLTCSHLNLQTFM